MACGPGCGHCGRCTEAWEREPTEVPCDECNKLVDDGDLLTTPYGRFCGDECATKYEADFTDYMKRQGWMTVQGNLLNQE